MIVARPLPKRRRRAKSLPLHVPDYKGIHAIADRAMPALAGNFLQAVHAGQASVSDDVWIGVLASKDAPRAPHAGTAASMLASMFAIDLNHALHSALWQAGQATVSALAHPGMRVAATEASIPLVAGLAVLAHDTGRVLMIQRALVNDDPAGGMWEFPGGHVDAGETLLDAAIREWQEETGHTLPTGRVEALWESPNGIYTGYVYVIADEAAVDLHDGRDSVTNSDDPDHDQLESIAWWSFSHLVNNPAMRRELATDVLRVTAAIDRVPVIRRAFEPPSVIRGLFNMIDDNALAWIKKRTASLVTAITNDTKQSILNIIDASFHGRWDVRQSARMIRSSIGLTPAQTDAVARMLDGMLADSSFTSERATKVASDYATRLVAYRAESIARTETLAAANAGVQQGYLQAVEQDLLNPDAQRTWIVTPDDILCEDCADLDGVEVGLQEEWDYADGPVENPPAHPRCRCAQGLVS